MNTNTKRTSHQGAEPDILVPDAQVRVELGNISLMTLNRRTRFDPSFPPLVKVEGRNYRFRSALEAYKARLLAEAVRDQQARLRQHQPKHELAR